MSGYREADPLAAALAKVSALQDANKELVQKNLEASNNYLKANLKIDNLEAEIYKLKKNRRSFWIDRFMNKWFVPLLAALMVTGLVAAIVTYVSDDRSALNMHSGIVVSRDYHPPYTTTSCHKVGNVTTCTPVHHPESFTITLGDGYHDERTISLRESDWRQHAPGSYMCFDSGPCEHPHDDAR